MSDIFDGQDEFYDMDFVECEEKNGFDSIVFVFIEFELWLLYFMELDMVVCLCGEGFDFGIVLSEQSFVEVVFVDGNVWDLYVMVYMILNLQVIEDEYFVFFEKCFWLGYQMLVVEMMDSQNVVV